MKKHVPSFLFVLSSVLAGGLASCGQKEGPAGGMAAPVEIRDPDGFYKVRSDASIGKHPEAGSVVGDGRAVEFRYDGSKGDGLSYQLFYVGTNGSVHPMGGGNLDAKGDGLFSQEIKVFNSSADKRPGFLEVITVQGSGMAEGRITGKNVSLGMYPVTFQVTE